MSNPTHEEAKWLIAHAKENNKVEWLAGWDSGRNYGKLCAEERIIKLLEELEQTAFDNYKANRTGEYGEGVSVGISGAIALIKGEK